MFEEKAKRFVDRIETHGRFDEGEFVSNLQSEIYPFKDRDKLSLLSDIQSRIIYEKETHEKDCPHPSDKCSKSKTYNKTLVFVKQELTDLGQLVDEPGDFRQTDPFISLQIDPLELTTVCTLVR